MEESLYKFGKKFVFQLYTYCKYANSVCHKNGAFLEKFEKHNVFSQRKQDLATSLNKKIKELKESVYQNKRGNPRI